MRKTLWLTAAAALALVVQSGPDGAVAQTRTSLDIYVVDVEGGNATLLVAPSGESLLIDTGNVAPAAAIRDAERIMAAAKDAGLTRIDNLIITHWHGDHYGGMAELAKRIPIRHFIDHGPNVQPSPEVDAFLTKVYPELYAKAKHTVAKPGDKIAVAGLDITVVTSAGESIKTALPGAGISRATAARGTIASRRNREAQGGFSCARLCGWEPSPLWRWSPNRDRTAPWRRRARPWISMWSTSKAATPRYWWRRRANPS